MNSNSIFDDSWYRVRHLKLNLMPNIVFVRQKYRGEYWYVVCDEFGHRFFRIREETYFFICCLEQCASVEEAWEKSLKENPESAPSQSEVVQVLSQFYNGGLLKSHKSADIKFLLEAKEKERAQKRKQLFSSLLFIKVPLWNPDPFIKKSVHLFSWCFKPFGFFLWVFSLITAVVFLTAEWNEFANSSNGILSFKNLPFLYLSIIILKGLHEFGHAYACRRYGCEVPQMGIMFLVFNPLPFVDVSSTYALSKKHQRVVVGIAGVVVEFFIAFVALILWAHLADGVFSRICYNMVITASVSTILFNLNPLLRFDGYHILCDLLETPNLQGRSQQLMKYWIEKYIFKAQAGSCPAETKGEALGFTFYFITSWIYRFFLMMGILLFVSKKFLIIGAILAVVFGFMWIFLPLIKGIKYLFSSPRLVNLRARSIMLSMSVIIGILAILTLVPFPNHFRASGIVKSLPHQNVYTAVSGELIKIVARPGDFVEKDQVLAILENKSLQQELELSEAELRRVNIIMRKERSSQGTQLKSLESYYESLALRTKNIENDINSLSIRAEVAGMWSPNFLNEYDGNTIPKGTEIGYIRGVDKFEFLAVVSQRDVGRIFTFKPKEAEVRLRGQYDNTTILKDLNAIPSDQMNLPSASLGYLGGGDIAVKSGSKSSSEAVEPFFEVRGEISDSNGLLPFHGQTGIARFKLPNASLWSQLSLRVRQLFQKEYRL